MDEHSIYLSFLPSDYVGDALRQRRRSGLVRKAPRQRQAIHIIKALKTYKIYCRQIGELLEIKDMLSDHSRSWTHQWKMEGRLEGQSLVLRRQLTSKFGPLSDAVQHRLQHATPAQLEVWTLNILGAACVDDVFDD